MIHCLCRRLDRIFQKKKKKKNCSSARYVCMYQKNIKLVFLTLAIIYFLFIFTPLRQLLLLDYEWTGVTNQQAEMINSTWKSDNGIYNRADTLKSDSN